MVEAAEATAAAESAEEHRQVGDTATNVEKPPRVVEQGKINDNTFRVIVPPDSDNHGSETVGVDPSTAPVASKIEASGGAESSSSFQNAEEEVGTSVSTVAEPNTTPSHDTADTTNATPTKDPKGSINASDATPADDRTPTNDPQPSIATTPTTKIPTLSNEPSSTNKSSPTNDATAIKDATPTDSAIADERAAAPATPTKSLSAHNNTEGTRHGQEHDSRDSTPATGSAQSTPMTGESDSSAAKPATRRRLKDRSRRRRRGRKKNLQSDEDPMDSGETDLDR